MPPLLFPHALHRTPFSFSPSVGPGLWEAQYFVPEYLEVRALFWDRETSWTYNPKVISALQQCSGVYYVPYHHARANLLRTPYRYLAQHALSDPSAPHRLHLDLTTPSHSIQSSCSFSLNTTTSRARASPQRGGHPCFDPLRSTEYSS
eukprot:TRINITY_DN7567_c0_g2_i2.p1 TRINITY_DN7567_c0_g2~~TRINITY_DN7567_c0_g2_i2.p1  ORF type:complete len:148 (-),score=20.00 TRINITY_DN7567_c0_g2_i2:119-562(-)